MPQKGTLEEEHCCPRLLSKWFFQEKPAWVVIESPTMRMLPSLLLPSAARLWQKSPAEKGTRGAAEQLPPTVHLYRAPSPLRKFLQGFLLPQLC